MLRLPLAIVGIMAMSGLAACSTSRPVANPGSPAYAPPGPASDPWGPYIREASARFGVPEKWIREVMRQESGGRQYLDGDLTTSPAGAMGLMQVMPVTYAEMRDRYGLGPDPYAPHDNILAGAAYIGEMYARYGSPGFLAAYNAGPGRLDAFLVDRTPLPAETVGYLTSVAPRLGGAASPTGPLAAYTSAELSADDLNSRSLKGMLPQPAPRPLAAAQMAYAADDNSAEDLNRRSLAASRPPATAAPAPVLQRASYAPAELSAEDLNRRSLAASRPPAAAVSAPPLQRPTYATAVPGALGGTGMQWGIQVGAFSTAAQAQAATAGAKARAPGLLDQARPEIARVTRVDGSIVYRAQLLGLSADVASDVCGRLAREQIACIMVAPNGQT
jgi:hypothetical protein